MSRATVVRWLRFNAVGAIGIAVQLAALMLLKSGLGVHYMVATALAVEIAVLHNFIWHERWTWADRTCSAPGWKRTAVRLAKFNLTTGLLSIVSNLLAMRALVGAVGMNYVAANLAAIAAASLMNFAASESWTFRQGVSSGAAR